MASDDLTGAIDPALPHDPRPVGPSPPLLHARNYGLATLTNSLPGSHRVTPKDFEPGCYVSEANRFVEEGVYPPGTMQVLANAGDALIFPHSLWHGVAAHRGHEPRVSVILAYGQICLRPHEYGALPREVTERMTPRQKRLCGDLGADEPNFYFPPNQSEIVRPSDG